MKMPKMALALNLGSIRAQKLNRKIKTIRPANYASTLARIHGAPTKHDARKLETLQNVRHITPVWRMTDSAFRRISRANSNGSASWNLGAKSSTES